MAKNDGEGYCFMDAQDLNKIREMLPLSKGVISLNSETTKEPPLTVTKVKRRLKQSRKPELNELEKRWLCRLKADYPSEDFLSQSIRFKLGNGIWYKPDFFCFQHEWPEETASSQRCKSTAWEVKGPKSWRGGFENLKVAAGQYPNIRWVLVWDDCGWNEQLILP